MSLRALCRQQQLIVERLAVTASSSASAQKTYTTTNRAARPRMIWGRVVELSSTARFEYAQSGINAAIAIYTEERDPEVDEKDRLVDGDDYLYVIGVINPDQQNRFWKVLCAEGEPQ